MSGFTVETDVIYRRNRWGVFADELNAAAVASMEDAVNQGTAVAETLRPGTGQHIRIHPESEGHRGRWVATGRAAGPQEFGARPHLIGAPGQYLRLPRHPVPGPVLHPGGTGKHFMRKSFEIISRRLPGILRKHYPR